MTFAGKMPSRGFPESEYSHRLERAHKFLKKQNLDALLLTSEVDIRYFTGFLTQFFQSPTRPWFLVVPKSGKPIAPCRELGLRTFAPGLHRIPMTMVFLCLLKP